MSKQTRFTAVLLAVSLLCNTTLPAMAEGSLDAPFLIEEATITDGNTISTEETTVPAEEATVPNTETAVLAEETTGINEGSMASTGDTTDSIEELTAPTEEITDPIEEISAPIGETTNSTEELTAPIEETTDLTDETSYPMSNFKLEGSTLQITSSQELLLLSYADPKEYSCLDLAFYPSDEENSGFNLLTETEDLKFRGLGSEEYPFQGEILFNEQTGPIMLDQPLFNMLSDDAKITGLLLESYVQGAEEGGLLAKTVTHGQGGNTWSITLTQPAPAENTTVNLIPLIFNLTNNADISLIVTDLSGLQVLGSGYLCDVMEENARMMLSGLYDIPSVNGSGDAVGGLVGRMKFGASLTVIGDSISVHGVTGSGNTGGVVGSAADPLLSLPPVVGSEGAVICGENVGGLLGELTYSQGDNSLAISLSNLVLAGSANAGGLFGVLKRDAGSLILDAKTDGIVFADGAGNCGSLIGTYRANSSENPMVLNGETVADEAGYQTLVGLANYIENVKSTDPNVTVEEAQAILDSILNTEIKPGEMSLLWWAAASGKVTAEGLAAELNAS